MGTLFAGGEDICFSPIGSATAVDTATTAARRTAYARCSLVTGNGVPSSSDGWQGQLSSLSSSFWLTARYYAGNATATAAARVLRFLDGSTSRIEVRNKSTNAGDWGIYKVNSVGTATLLVTASTNITGPQTKIDIQISYGTSGFVKMYYNGTLVADTGVVDVTTDGATSLSSFVLGVRYTGGTGPTYWSEIIAHTDDTRSLSLCTLPPAANGNAYTFDSGSFADIDEVTNSDADIITSGTANQLAQFTVNSSGVTGNPGVKSVAVWARAQRGASGPQNMQLNVRTASTDYVSGSKALALSMAGYQNTWDTNPNTGLAWGYTDLTAAGLNIGVKSIT